MCTSTLLYGMRCKPSETESVPQPIASCEWIPGANKHRTLLDVETTLVAPSNETSPFSPSAANFGHGLMWRPNGTRLDELQQQKDEENVKIERRARVCVAVAVVVAMCTAWLLTQPPEYADSAEGGP